MADSWNKKEREKKRQQNKREKEEKKKERKENPGGKGLDSMMAYIDENGNISSTPPDHNNRPQYNLEDIEISVPKQKPPDPADLIRQGTVTFFNDAKGYGFIRDHVTQESVFVHVNALQQAIGEGTKVTFEVEMGPKGANAVNVKVTG